jgi:phosphate transport system substrate-binding protein
MVFTLVLTGVLVGAWAYLAQFERPADLEAATARDRYWRPSKATYFKCSGAVEPDAIPSETAEERGQSPDTPPSSNRAGSAPSDGMTQATPRSQNGSMRETNTTKPTQDASTGDAPVDTGSEAAAGAGRESARGGNGTMAADEALLPYAPVAGIDGPIASVGSDTLASLMTNWSEGFKQHYRDVRFSVESKGSTTGPPALIEGSADIAPMTREMNAEEIKKLENRFGYKPTKIAVCIDALAVFVHAENPVKSLSLAQVDAIFSSTRKRGCEVDLKQWGQLIADESHWHGLEMTLYGQNSSSGNHGFFKEQVLSRGDVKSTVNIQTGPGSVVEMIAQERTAIGYSSIGYKAQGVRAVPLSGKHGSAAYEATAENCYSGKYPLSRYLYIYVNLPPDGELRPVVREFLRFILSRDGQEIVIKDGFIPLTTKMVDQNLKAFR